MSLEGLSTEQLLYLGGLKERCSAGMRCAAHGLALPCELCELEDVGHLGAICETCGHRFDSAPSGKPDRACKSVEVFEAIGTIPFAETALDNQRRRENERRAEEEVERIRADHERKLAQQREAAARAATEALAEQRRRDRELRAAAAREAEERSAAERAAAERAAADAAAERDAAERAAAWAAVERRRQAEVTALKAAEQQEREESAARRRWHAVALVGVLALVAWTLLPFKDNPSKVSPASGGMKASVGAVQPAAPGARTGISSTASSATAPGNLAVPTMSGLLTDVPNALALEEAAHLRARLMELLSAGGPTVRLLIVDSTGTESIEDFGVRAGNAWNANTIGPPSDVLITIAKRETTAHVALTNAMQERLGKTEAARLIAAGFRPAVERNGLPAGIRKVVDDLERAHWSQQFASLSDEPLQAATLAAMDGMATAAARWAGKTDRMAPAEQGLLDAAVARLESLPRPARGDRKVARQLHAQGLSLIGQTGFESLAVEKLKLAHSADPLDVQIVNDLAYAELSSGDPAAAWFRLQQTLRLAPRRTSAWVNLAETAVSALPNEMRAQRNAVHGYWLGFYFSENRGKTIEYLRTKVASTDASPALREAAAQALAPLELLMPATTVGKASEMPRMQ
jgi:hypothetical protein